RARRRRDRRAREAPGRSPRSERRARPRLGEEGRPGARARGVRAGAAGRRALRAARRLDPGEEANLPRCAVKRILFLLLLAGGAHAEGIGLYAPTAPFSGPVARLDYVTGLAERLGGDLVGRAYAKAADFNAAVKRGELGYAVVDFAYLAAVGA